MRVPRTNSPADVWVRHPGSTAACDNCDFPRTGTNAKPKPLPDRVLRPNHVLRSQIVEFRERHGLPALPGWEPDPQETVTAAPPPLEEDAAAAAAGTGGAPLCGDAPP